MHDIEVNLQFLNAQSIGSQRTQPDVHIPARRTQTTIESDTKRPKNDMYIRFSSRNCNTARTHYRQTTVLKKSNAPVYVKAQCIKLRYFF